MNRTAMIVLCVTGLIFSPRPVRADDSALQQEAARALHKATEFFRTQVATEGGYLWRYSEDLSRREGEGKATATMVWVQPPGTPSVGMAYLVAYEATGDEYYLEAARETAYALVRGQLRSGGWDYSIEFDPQRRKRFAYRVDAGNETGRNSTTLDDDTTQAALRLLMRVDKALRFKDGKIHEAVEYALDSLLRVQYPNGAWPQRYDRFPDPKESPVKRASYPESWSRTYPGSDYRAHYTINDNNLSDMIDTLLEASRIYGQQRYREAVEKVGEFFLLAQMPEPQPAWAQQYDADMRPAWARKFEPPAVTGGESQHVLRSLLVLYRETGDRKYLEPIARALDYFRRSRLPDGRLARFYELKTNKPLYFTKKYELTYDDSDLPTHYGFKVSDGTARIAQEYERLRSMDLAELKRPEKPARPRPTASLEKQARSVISSADSRGRWVEDGPLRYHGPDDPTRRVIDCQTFIKNVEILSNYLCKADEPLALHPDNPHYFLFRGKPTVLITSGEHYGAVLNLDFDYVKYLDTLQADGLNLTRTFTGSYVEPLGAFKIARNTLAPAANRFICPWARSSTPGYANGGNKFDLNQWDAAYFARLKDFVTQAGKRGVIVEMNLFCPFYDEAQWKLSPMNAANNVNGVGNVPRNNVYTLDKHGGLLAVHEAMVRKIVGELRDFDNLYYEICNEPYFGGVTLAWQHRMADTIVDAEKSFARRHLISQNIANGKAKVENPHRAVSIFNFHYAAPPDTVALNYGLNKVIGDNETGFKGTGDTHYRMEGWEFILAGGGLYNNLDYSFTAGHEDGTFQYPATQPGGGTTALRRQLKILKDFIHSFDFLRMKPDNSVIRGGVPEKARARALVEPGRQYAVYLFGGKQAELALELPAGTYDVQWINPISGAIDKQERIQHSGGNARLASPPFREDIALKLRRSDSEKR